MDLLGGVLGPSLEPVGQFRKPFGPSKLSEARNGDNANIIEDTLKINIVALLGCPGDILGSPEAILERLEAILGRLRGILGELGRLLDLLWPSLTSSCNILGQVEGRLGRRGGHIQAVLGRRSLA